MGDVTLVGGQQVRAHGPEECKGQACCIHAPSNHHMVSWPQNFRFDRGIMERLCPHGIGHPDPDDIRCKSSWAERVHGCDGCCKET